MLVKSERLREAQIEAKDRMLAGVRADPPPRGVEGVRGESTKIVAVGDMRDAYGQEEIHLRADQFTAERLLAIAADEGRDPHVVQRGGTAPLLTPAGAEKLAAILAAGSSPTPGFFRRYRAIPAEDRGE